MPKASPSFLAQFKYITGGMTNSNDTPGIRNQDSGRAETVIQNCTGLEWWNLNYRFCFTFWPVSNLYLKAEWFIFTERKHVCFQEWRIYVLQQSNWYYVHISLYCSHKLRRNRNLWEWNLKSSGLRCIWAVEGILLAYVVNIWERLCAKHLE